jgi:hypothetical protein
MAQNLKTGTLKSKEVFMYNQDSQVGDGKLTLGDDGALQFIMGGDLMAEFFIQTDDQENTNTAPSTEKFVSMGAPVQTLSEASVVFSPSAEGSAYPFCTNHGHPMGANYSGGLPVTFYSGSPEIVKVSVTVDAGLFVFSPVPTFRAFSVYVFDQSDPSNVNHPLRFSESDQSTELTGEQRAYGEPGSGSVRDSAVLDTGAQTDYALSCLVTGERSTNGVLVDEPGMMLYSYNGRVHFTAGPGNTVSFQPAADLVESWVEASVSADNNIKLYQDGVLKTLKVYSGGTVKEAGQGGIAQVHTTGGTTADNEAGWANPGDGAYGGTLHTVKLWPGTRYST